MGPVRDSAEAGALLSITLNFRYSAAKAAVVGYRLAWPTTRRRAIHPPTASAFAWRLGQGEARSRAGGGGEHTVSGVNISGAGMAPDLQSR